MKPPREDGLWGVVSRYCHWHVLGLTILQETSFSGPKTVTRKVSTSSAKNSTAMLVTVVQPDVTSPNRLPSNGSGDELSPWHVSVGAESGPRKTMAPPRRVTSTEQRRVITTELWRTFDLRHEQCASMWWRCQDVAVGLSQVPDLHRDSAVAEITQLTWAALHKLCVMSTTADNGNYGDVQGLCRRHRHAFSCGHTIEL